MVLVMAAVGACDSRRILAGELEGVSFIRDFEPNEGCRWVRPSVDGLEMNDHYIAGPRRGEDREVWLAKMRAYREQVRQGSAAAVIEVDYRGVRAWTRMAPALARTLDLKGGDRVEVAVEARFLSGNRGLCIAFDWHDRRTGQWKGWSGVQAVLRGPTADSAEGPVRGEQALWHRVQAAVTVPAFDAAGQWSRLIIGMDATRDPAPGKLQMRAIELKVGDPGRSRALELAARTWVPGTRVLDRRLYDRQDLAWTSRVFTCHFTFMYDRSVYDVVAGKYALEALLEDGRREFGGYDALVLWQGYPRLGVDDRNQFDMYRDMPGGLGGIRDLVRQAHAGGVKVFVDYNPWDTGTRREACSDEEALAALVGAVEADGIFLDTMSAASATLRRRLDATRPGVALAPEGHPDIDQLPLLSLSWAQWLQDPLPPGLLHLKWLEPRHVQHQIRRWDRSHGAEIETAFFNGSGVLVWENVFGTYNPWPAADRRTWRRAVPILRHFEAQFSGDGWDPFYPTRVERLYCHRWPGRDATVYTLLNLGGPIRQGRLIEVAAEGDTVYFDLWTGEPARVEAAGGGKVEVTGSVERLGCVLAVKRRAVDKPLGDLLSGQRELAAALLSPVDRRNFAHSVVEPVTPFAGTPRVSVAPPGMVLVPGATFRMKIEHVRRECGCYPDPGVSESQWEGFLWGSPFDGVLKHDIGPLVVASFFVDEAEVSNADFKRFLDASGYQPRVRENFLRHWPGGRMPTELADHPVVYVDLEDARAYARWAGKRLPTEAEWHLAAQGTDGRSWPWGDRFDAGRLGIAGGHTYPVRSDPEGRSPYGCHHMAGNVWEWTESERDDGHTRFVVIRGGSHYAAEGSIWYADGGPRPCDHHAKFICMWPGLDRCSTIGFRCVADVARSAAKPNS